MKKTMVLIPSLIGLFFAGQATPCSIDGSTRILWPQRDQTDVPLNATIQAACSYYRCDKVKLSLVDTTIRQVDTAVRQEVEVAQEIVEEKKRILLKPLTLLKPETRYEVRVQDEYENALRSQFFITGKITDTAPPQIDVAQMNVTIDWADVEAEVLFDATSCGPQEFKVDELKARGWWDEERYGNDYLPPNYNIDVEKITDLNDHGNSFYNPFWVRVTEMTGNEPGDEIGEYLLFSDGTIYFPRLLASEAGDQKGYRLLVEDMMGNIQSEVYFLTIHFDQERSTSLITTERAEVTEPAVPPEGPAALPEPSTNPASGGCSLLPG